MNIIIVTGGHGRRDLDVSAKNTELNTILIYLTVALSALRKRRSVRLKRKG